jgi:hypothetical protein
MTPTPHTPSGWRPFVGHAVAVVALALGGLSSFHALRAEVIELRAVVQGIAHTEADHCQRERQALRECEGRSEAEFAELRQEIKELRGDLRDLKALLLRAPERP